MKNLQWTTTNVQLVTDTDDSGAWLGQPIMILSCLLSIDSIILFFVVYITNK